MPQSLSQVYLHIVFGTKYRKDLIHPEIAQPLYAYIAGIIKSLGGRPICINGMPDHIHILATLPRTVTIARYLEEIKRGSSKWIKTQGPAYRRFAWQGGYGVFSVSRFGVDKVSRYIQNQQAHHAKADFRQEFVGLLEEYEVPYDERYLWD